MPVVKHTITRVATPTTVARSSLSAGQVFQIVKRDGTHGRKTYVALGHNGKMFSINTANGVLASTVKGEKRVAIVGKATFSTSALKFPGTDTTRGALRNDAVFRVKESIYLNLGTLKDGNFVGVNAGKAMGEDYAVGRDGGKHVQQVGTWSVEVTLAK